MRRGVGWGMSLLIKNKENMHRTNNLLLLQAAKNLSRELRKFQTVAEKIFWENVRIQKIKRLKVL